jgi:hypothetical protein
MPYIPGIPYMPYIPGIPYMPYIPGIPYMPYIPGIPYMPVIPGIPYMPVIPGIPYMPVIPCAVAGWLAATPKVTLAASATACSILRIVQRDINRTGCIILVLPSIQIKF